MLAPPEAGAAKCRRRETALLHPLRIGAHLLVCCRGEPDHVEQLGHAPAARRAVHPRQHRVKPERIARGLVLREAMVLGQIADGPARRGVTHATPEQLGAARGRAHDVEQDLDEGRLPGAVAPEQAVDRAGSHFERNAGQRLHGASLPAISLAHVLDEDGEGHRSCRVIAAKPPSPANLRQEQSCPRGRGDKGSRREIVPERRPPPIQRPGDPNPHIASGCSAERSHTSLACLLPVSACLSLLDPAPPIGRRRAVVDGSRCHGPAALAAPAPCSSGA